MSASLVEQLRAIEQGDGTGDVTLPGRRRLHVSHLGKPYFPADGITKGDVLRYYAAVATPLMRAVRDRPLILRRYPDGITGPSFYQQAAGRVPPGVATAVLASADGKRARRIIASDLATVLYTVQIGSIALNPWQSRVSAIDVPDECTIDLDPGDDVSFDEVVQVAKVVRRVLDALGLRAALKTSGSRGLHIVLPLPRGATWDTSAALANLVADRTVEAAPSLATVERALARRPAGTTYVDAQQNARGKSVAAAYSVRAKAGAPVSAPLDWGELRRGLRISSFTVKTMSARVARVGDLWQAAMSRRNTSRDVARALRGR